MARSEKFFGRIDPRAELCVGIGGVCIDLHGLRIGRNFIPRALEGLFESRDCGGIRRWMRA